MSKKSKLLNGLTVLLALMLAVALLFAACSSPTNSETGGGGGGKNPPTTEQPVTRGGPTGTTGSSPSSSGSGPSLGGTATISGVYEIGEALTVDTSGVTGGSGAFTYQWKSGGLNTGTGGDTYTLLGSDAGKAVSCVVTRAGVSGSVTATGGTVKYTLSLDKTGLLAGDSVSFSDSLPLDQIAASGGTTVTIYYTLTGGHDRDELELSFGLATPAQTATVPATSSASYTVSGGDTGTGFIVVRAEFTHTNLASLDRPTGVSFDKGGAISFAEGTNSATAGGMSYTYTLYKDPVTAIAAYTDKAITAGGGTVGALSGEMLSGGVGSYYVRVTAHTTNGLFMPESESLDSNPVYVYSVAVTVAGNGTETVNGKTSGFTEYAFGGETVTLTAAPGSALRKVTWSGGDSASGNVCTVTRASATSLSVTATFADKVPQAAAVSSYGTAAPVVDEAIAPTVTYTANDGGTEGAHQYQWKRSDNDDRSGSVTDLATTKNYTTVGADYGKYIWLEVTPSGSEGLTGAMAQGAVLRVGVRLTVSVSGGGGGTATVSYNLSTPALSAVVYGAATVAVDKTVLADDVAWTASPPVGSFDDATAISATYTPPSSPAVGTIALTAGLTSTVTYTVAFDSMGGSAVASLTGVGGGSTISAPTPPTKPGYAFSGKWYKEDALTNEWVFSTATVTANITLYAGWVYDGSFILGDTGPGGGKIFYVSTAGFTLDGYGSPGDTGYFAPYTAHYLEAAPSDITSPSPTLAWASGTGFNVLIPDLSQSSADPADWGIGRGRKNTAIIISHGSDKGYATPAAVACAAPYDAGSKTDWFLPSKDELNELYNQITLLGIPASGYYWSSSQNLTNYAWFQSFITGSQFDNPKGNTASVRAIRAF